MREKIPPKSVCQKQFSTSRFSLFTNPPWILNHQPSIKTWLKHVDRELQGRYRIIKNKQYLRVSKVQSHLCKMSLPILWFSIYTCIQENGNLGTRGDIGSRLWNIYRVSYKNIPSTESTIIATQLKPGTQLVCNGWAFWQLLSATGFLLTKFFFFFSVLPHEPADKTFSW